MTLDEAIQHSEETAERLGKQGKCKACAAEHRQLAEWLKELRGLREVSNEWKRKKERS